MVWCVVMGCTLMCCVMMRCLAVLCAVAPEANGCTSRAVWCSQLHSSPQPRPQQKPGCQAAGPLQSCRTPEGWMRSNNANITARSHVRVCVGNGSGCAHKGANVHARTDLSDLPAGRCSNSSSPYLLPCDPASPVSPPRMATGVGVGVCGLPII